MVAIRTRALEACETQPHLLWDTIWVQRVDASGGYGDWILAGPGDQIESRGGLRSEAAIHTATMLQIFTDRRLPDDLANPFDDGDPRGWWGDSIRLEGEPDVPLGSLLWTLHRSILDSRIALLARDYAEEALKVLLDQGAVARTDVATVHDEVAGTLFMTIRHFSQDGAKIYDQRFGVLWDQERRPAQMNFGDTLTA